MLCCFALFVCLTLLAEFFLSCTCTCRLHRIFVSLFRFGRLFHCEYLGGEGGVWESMDGEGWMDSGRVDGV